MSTTLQANAMSDEPPARKVSVPPPPRQNRGLHVAVPEPQNNPTPNNMAKPNSGIQDLNFKVSQELHRAFKITAAEHGMPMKDLLDAAFRCWVEHFGNDQDKARLPVK